MNDNNSSTINLEEFTATVQELKSKISSMLKVEMQALREYTRIEKFKTKPNIFNKINSGFEKMLKAEIKKRTNATKALELQKTKLDKLESNYKAYLSGNSYDKFGKVMRYGFKLTEITCKLREYNKILMNLSESNASKKEFDAKYKEASNLLSQRTHLISSKHETIVEIIECHREVFESTFKTANYIIFDLFEMLKEIQLEYQDNLINNLNEIDDCLKKQPEKILCNSLVSYFEKSKNLKFPLLENGINQTNFESIPRSESVDTTDDKYEEDGVNEDKKYNSQKNQSNVVENLYKTSFLKWFSIGSKKDPKKNIKNENDDRETNREHGNVEHPTDLQKNNDSDDQLSISRETDDENIPQNEALEENILEGQSDEENIREQKNTQNDEISLISFNFDKMSLFQSQTQSKSNPIISSNFPFISAEDFNDVKKESTNQPQMINPSPGVRNSQHFQNFFNENENDPFKRMSHVQDNCIPETNNPFSLNLMNNFNNPTSMNNAGGFSTDKNKNLENKSDALKIFEPNPFPFSNIDNTNQENPPKTINTFDDFNNPFNSSIGPQIVNNSRNLIDQAKQESKIPHINTLEDTQSIQAHKSSQQNNNIDLNLFIQKESFNKGENNILNENTLCTYYNMKIDEEIIFKQSSDISGFMITKKITLEVPSQQFEEFKNICLENSIDVIINNPYISSIETNDEYKRTDKNTISVSLDELCFKHNIFESSFHDIDTKISIPIFSYYMKTGFDCPFKIELNKKRVNQSTIMFEIKIRISWIKGLPDISRSQISAKLSCVIDTKAVKNIKLTKSMPKDCFIKTDPVTLIWNISPLNFPSSSSSKEIVTDLRAIVSLGESNEFESVLHAHQTCVLMFCLNEHCFVDDQLEMDPSLFNFTKTRNSDCSMFESIN